MRARRLTAMAAGLALATVVTGCVQEDQTVPAGPGVEETTDTGTPQPTMAIEDRTGDATLLRVADSGLGEILVDADGLTLYLFTVDDPGVSNCAGPCLQAWPALEGEPEAGAGVDADLLGSLVRDDGTVQVTYADWPLYYFAGDAEPGGLTGQGVEGVWYVVAPDGAARLGEVPDESGPPGRGYDY